MKALLARWSETLGTAGAIGIGLVVFCAAFYFGTVRPAELRLSGLLQEQGRLEGLRDQRIRDGVAAGALSTEERLKDFYGLLASEQAIGELLEAIDAAARRNGVQLRQGSYRFSWDAGSRAGRCEVTYTGQTQYFRARIFLHEVLSELPMLALDEVTFQRQQTSAGATDMTARFSILVRRSS